MPPPSASTARQKVVDAHDTLVRSLASPDVTVDQELDPGLVLLTIAPPSPTATQDEVPGAQEIASSACGADVE